MQKMQVIYDVLVIGAGQAGLALGYYLQQQKKDFLLLDASARVGDSWRNRYDSLRLFTPAPYCNLPGWPLPFPKNHYPTKDEIADYLEQYAQRFQLPLALEQKVLSLTRTNGVFQAQTSTQLFQARQVVIATGPFQTPFVPSFSSNPDERVLQLHSSQYLNPAQIPAGKVLVVGAGNSGAQLAVELAQTHEVHLSVRKQPRFSSLQVLGQSVFWWATKTGAIYAPPTSFLGKMALRQADVVYGRELEKLLRKGDIQLRPEIKGFNQAQTIFQDGSQTTFGSILWATGFKPCYDWLQIPGAIAANGSPVHQNGISPIAGLFYLGLSWQRSRSSALLLGAGRDAWYIAQQLS
ncbi:flavin-containing monooxygenase [Rufibacter hautae]|uniref:SidA/IucD/PvdA family monooxygenase n=1 Tax=Rufibacter hautae TaxID=2595005 RepID=A0A5B6T8E3_9BACT|nr:NAD(P)/FAD-dependent oxidoreductase [Rufibacter hautae]KAA3436187.1 SidA/IucD/PvdA family monooxygenase [Rufibacter hautae]